jgi:O-methyltransferase
MIKTATVRNFCRFLFVNTFGRLPDSSDVFDKTSCWIRFSKWCVEKGSLVSPYNPAELEYEERYKLYEEIIHRETLESRRMRFLEFGVARGDSIRWWAQHCHNPEHLFVGFDTFFGLPENWEGAPKGKFSMEGKLPEIDDPRCGFQVGLFQKSLPPFLKRFDRSGSRLVVHLDADLYSSTLLVLASLAPFFEVGDLLLFDEFCSTRHEFRAFDDFTRAFQFNYEIVGAVSSFEQVCLKVAA